MSEIQLPQENLYKIQCPATLIQGSQIMFVGEAPGSNELIWHVCNSCGNGAPYPGLCRVKFCRGSLVFKPQGFVGASGAMLRRACQHAKINFDACSRNNVVKRKPGGEDFGSFYHDPKERKRPTQELQWWRNRLCDEINSYRPNVVVANGNEALKALCPSLAGITTWQGSILISEVIKDLKVIPMLHPSFIMRDNWQYYYVMSRQMKRIAVEAQGREIIQKEPLDEFCIAPTIKQVLSFLTVIGASRQEWYLDIETVGDSIRCFGLYSAAVPNFAMCVPLQKTSGPAWSVVDEASIWRELSLTFRDNPHFANQNCVYDLDYLLDFGCEPSNIEFDSMQGTQVAYPEYPKKLEFTTMLYTFYPYYKDEGQTWKKKEPDDKVFTYNCKDMVATAKVSKALKEDINSAGLADVYERRVRRFYPIAMEMQRNRLRLDRHWHDRLKDLLVLERDKQQSNLDKLIGYPINVKSRDQVAKLLFTELRLPAKKKRGSQNITTDENALRELRAAHPSVEALNKILEIRHLRTKKSNFIDVEFDNASNCGSGDGESYLGYTVGISSAKTGRWAFGSSTKWRGSSPQTVSKVMRLQYAPPIVDGKSYVFWQRDLSQAEARIVAWLSNCRFLLDVFNSPIKIHKVVGGRIYKKDPLKIESDSMEYDISKRIVHAYNYMTQWKKIATVANLPYDFARQAYEAYSKEVPEIGQWWRKTGKEATEKGRLTTPFGRVRQCFSACSAVAATGTLPDDILRDLVSYVPQATVPDLLNEAMWKVWNENDWVRWHQQGHDSYLASGPANRTLEFYDKTQEAHNISFLLNGHDCHIPSEMQWGYLWGAMLEYKIGEDTSYAAWQDRATKEGFFEESKIIKKLYQMN